MEDVVYSEHNVDSADGLIGARTADVCLSANATYWHRVDDEDIFNFCTVRTGSADAILFLSIAIIAASILHIRGFSQACMLVLGCITECLVHVYNLGRIGNAYTIWIGVSPDVLLYGMLPPLMLNAAIKVKWPAFQKSLIPVTSSLLVTGLIVGCILTGINAFLYDFVGYGWSYVWIVVFISALMVTDSTESSQVIDFSDGPEFLGDFLKSEAVVSNVLFVAIFSKAQMYLKGSSDVFNIDFCLKTLISMVGGLLMGLLCAWITSTAVMMVAGSKFKQVGLLYGMSFLVFYVAECFEMSGAFSVITLGLYMSATGKYKFVGSVADIDAPYHIIGNTLRGLSMLLGGALLTNFIIRAQEKYSVGYIVPLVLTLSVYMSLFALRWVSLTISLTLTQTYQQAKVFSRGMPFMTAAGIRGPVTMILMSSVASWTADDAEMRVKYGEVLLQAFEMGLALVALTLTLNLPTLSPILQHSGFLAQSKMRKSITSYVKASLNRRTREIIKDLKSDEEDILRGVDWTALDKFARENTSQDSKSNVYSWNPLIALRNLCFQNGYRESGEGRHALSYKLDIEQPLLGAHHALKSSEMQRIQAANYGDRETPFISKSNETNNPFLNADSRASSSSYLPSQGSPGWSSPTETIRPSQGDLRTWWNTGYRHVEPEIQNNLSSILVHQEDELLAGKRSQVILAIRRYVHAKEQKGLISPKGASLFLCACEEALERRENSLSILASVNKELETFDVQSAAWIYHSSRIIIYSSPETIQKIIGPPVKFLTRWIGDFLSKSLLTACEVMITYHNALGFILKSRLFETTKDPEIVSIIKIEVEAEMNRVYRNILDRETEAPAHFEAVQTYRAMMAVTTMQVKHVYSMFRGGILSASEFNNLVSHIQSRKEWLEYIGPKGNNWQSVGTLFFSLPIFKGLDDDILQTILDNGLLREFGEGDLVWDDSQNSSEYGFCIIIRGLVKSTSDNGKEHFYGSGTLLGILPALTDSKVRIPGSSITVAQSSRHDKGVLVFFFPKDVLDEIKSRAAEGEQQFEKMLLKLQRQAAMDIHSSMKATTMNNIEIKYQSYESQLRQNRKEMIALSQMNEAHDTDVSEDSEDSIETRRILTRGKTFARKICSKITQELENAICVELNPYEPFIQRSHFIILAGSVQRQSPNTGRKLGRSISMSKISAPYVVPMLSQHDTSINFDAKGFLSGHQGALIIVCDVNEDSRDGNRQSMDLDDGSFSNVILFAEDTTSGAGKSASDLSYED